MRDPNEYNITSRQTRLDGETLFEARVVELPDVVGYGNTRQEAESEALDAIAGLQVLARKLNHDFPAPISMPTDYSGRVTLRISRNLHKQVALLARMEDVSLNHFISEAITTRVAVLSSPHLINADQPLSLIAIESASKIPQRVLDLKNLKTFGTGATSAVMYIPTIVTRGESTSYEALGDPENLLASRCISVSTDVQ